MKSDDQLARIREIVALIEDPMSYEPDVKIDQVRPAYTYLGQTSGRINGVLNISYASRNGHYRASRINRID
jgi:hypothetical protein